MPEPSNPLGMDGIRIHRIRHQPAAGLFGDLLQRMGFVPARAPPLARGAALPAGPDEPDRPTRMAGRPTAMPTVWRWLCACRDAAFAHKSFARTLGAYSMNSIARPFPADWDGSGMRSRLVIRTVSSRRDDGRVSSIGC